MIIKRVPLILLVLALVVVPQVSGEEIFGPIDVGVGIAAKTPLYVGEEAEFEATIRLFPESSSSCSPKKPFGIAVIWTDRWYPSGGTQILGDDIIYTTLDPKKPLVFPFRVRVEKADITATWMVYTRVTPEIRPCLGVNSDGSTEADIDWQDLGKGWILIGFGGTSWGIPAESKDGQLVTAAELQKMTADRQARFSDKLAATRAGSYRPDESILAAIDQGLAEEMQMEMDSALVNVSDAMRVELAMVAEELGRRTKTPAEDAAAFLCRMVRSRWRSIWRTAPNADINKVAAPVLEIHGLERLEFMYRETRRVAASPTGKAWEAFARADKGEMTWDEAEAELDSLLREHPEDKELLRNASGIRDIIEELKKEEKEDEGEVGDSNIPSGERDGWVIVQGIWNYRDHAYTKEFGLELSTTDRPVRSAVTYVRVYGPGGPYWWGPSLTYENGSFTISEYWWLDGIGLTTWIWAEGPVVHPASLMHVRNKQGRQYRFEGNSGNSTVPTDITINLGTSYPEGDSTAAMNIYDVLFQGWTKIPGNKPWAHDLKVFWEPGYMPPDSVTAYYPDTETIHLIGAIPKTDEWDDDVILHEMGHWLHDIYGIIPANRVGKHKWTHAYPRVDQRGTAYTEGWATFYAAYAESGYVLNPSLQQHFVNTYGGLGGNRRSYYACVEDPWDHNKAPRDSVTKLEWGNYNEGSVCAALWDIYDGNNEPYDLANCPEHYDPLRDNLTNGILNIWKTFADDWFEIDTFSFFLLRWFERGYGHMDEISEIAQHYGCARNLRADHIDSFHNRKDTHWVKVQPGQNQEYDTTLRLTNHNDVSPESFEISESIPWLEVEPLTGTIPAVADPGSGTADLTVTVNSAGLSVGEHTGTITITNTGSNRCTLQMPVQMIVLDTFAAIGSVVARGGRSALEDAVVEAWEGGWPEGSVVARDTTDSDGVFVLEASEGTYDIRAYCDAYFPTLLTDQNCPSMGITIFLDEHASPEISSLTCSFVGYSSTLQGVALQPGDVITASDPDGIICGVTSVTAPGAYGPLVVYGDDPATSEVDEGAIEGDTLIFRVNNLVAEPQGPGSPVWTNGGSSIQVELAAMDGAPNTPEAVVIYSDSIGTYLSWWPVFEDVYGNEEETIYYLVYRSQNAFLDISGLSPFGYGDEYGYEDYDGGAGNAEDNYYYIVTVKDHLGQESTPSETLGEFDFSLGSRGESESRRRQPE